MRIHLFTLHTVDGREMNERQVIMERWWKDNAREKPQYLEKHLSSCCFVHHSTT